MKRYKESGRILLEKQAEISRVGKGRVGEGWMSGTAEQSEEGEVGGCIHSRTKTEQCRI